MPLQVFCRNCAQYRNEWCKLKVDSPDPDMVRDCQYYRGMTNADRIRSMTDEELAQFLYEYGGSSPNCDRVYLADDYKSCKDCWLDWLKEATE